MVEKTKGKILITGSEGMLGRALFKELTQNYLVIGTSKQELDVTERKKVNQVVLEIKPWIIIHTAALTDVDLCEDESQLAYQINALGTKNIAQASKAIGAILIYLSTDYVFDGMVNVPYKEDSVTNPINIYGQTKLEGEKFISDELDHFIIIRSSWLFGRGKAGFVEKIIEQAKRKKVISVVSDKYASPTFTLDLSKAIARIIDLIDKKRFYPNKTTLHITNSGYCSWIEYAKKIVELAKIDGVTFKPISSGEFNFKAKRPKFSVLDNSSYNKLSGQPLRPWPDALKEYLPCLSN